eukprot:CAMPEP_0117574072 /NCGR_PEP_ID=MMETSP0784-20121206/61354_1 /TAXON_ID=39447 /ORGANISM="" /LENGTH=167 /DNA_ID=CAMNT_0005372803 /DNA_START=38 /DNA_END=541 /DNA_ORIENTATION=+
MPGFAAFGRRAVVALLAVAPLLAAQTSDLSALQTAFKVHKAVPGASPRPASSVQSTATMESIRMRVAYLEGLAAKQDKRLSKLRLELTGDAGSNRAEDVEASAASPRVGALKMEIEALERRLHDRKAVTQRLLAATQAALDRGEAATVVATANDAPLECPAPPPCTC